MLFRFFFSLSCAWFLNFVHAYNSGIQYGSFTHASLKSLGCYSCFAQNYDYAMNSPEITACSGPHLFVDAIASSSSTFELGAFASAKDIQTQTLMDKPHSSNSVYWYFTPNLSFGFADNDDVDQQTADVGSSNPWSRLSWHIDNGNRGYLAGSSTQQNSDMSRWEKWIYNCPGVPTLSLTHAPSAPTVRPSTFAPSSLYFITTTQSFTGISYSQVVSLSFRGVLTGTIVFLTGVSSSNFFLSNIAATETILRRKLLPNLTVRYNITFHDSSLASNVLTTLNAAISSGQFASALRGASHSNTLIVEGQFTSTNVATASNTQGGTSSTSPGAIAGYSVAILLVGAICIYCLCKSKRVPPETFSRIEEPSQVEISAVPATITLTTPTASAKVVVAAVAVVVTAHPLCYDLPPLHAYPVGAPSPAPLIALMIDDSH